MARPLWAGPTAGHRLRPAGEESYIFDIGSSSMTMPISMSMDSSSWAHAATKVNKQSARRVLTVNDMAVSFDPSRPHQQIGQLF
jgi:hypothetical protein